MKFIRCLKSVDALAKGSVVTIGNFDGVHLGHQSVLAQLKEQAKQMGLPSVVMFFEPQPIEFFAPDKAPKRLYRLKEKLLALKEIAIDYVFCINFDKDFSQLTAQQFVEQILIDTLSVKQLIIGDDFRFGKNRQGDFGFLQTMAEAHHFNVQNTHTFSVYEKRVSSTLIRELVSQNNFKQVSQLLGRPYSLHGRIIHGKKLGRTIGFPTINIKIGKIPMIVEGIFAVRVKGLDNTRPHDYVNGVASIGTRPTVNGIGVLLEIYLLNFDRMVYGQKVNVEFLHHIRSEQKFVSVEVMLKHIEEDVEIAKDFFETMK